MPPWAYANTNTIGIVTCVRRRFGLLIKMLQTSERCLIVNGSQPVIWTIEVDDNLSSEYPVTFRVER